MALYKRCWFSDYQINGVHARVFSWLPVPYPELYLNQWRKEKNDLEEKLDYFADDGLRTLLYAKKELDEKFYNEWAAQLEVLIHQEKNLWLRLRFFFLQEISVLMDREKKMEEHYDLIEKDFDVLGATAIEDKLQDDVGKWFILCVL